MKLFRKNFIIIHLTQKDKIVIEKMLELLKERGLSQNSLATFLKVTPSTISEWKKGNLRPAVEDVIQVAQFFSVSTDYLLGLSENPKSTEIQIMFEQLTLEEQQAVLQNLYNQFPQFRK